MSEFIKKESWTKFCNEIAGGGYISSHLGVMQTLDADDVKHLCAVLTEEPGTRRNAALWLLVALSHQSSPLLRQDSGTTQKMVAGLWQIAEHDYPLGKWGQQAMTLWQRMEPEGAARFVNQWVDGHEITDTVRQRVTMDLSFGNQESFVRLRRYAESHPEVALTGNARLVLERTAPDWREKLAAYGLEWRERRDCSTLLHLTNQMVDRRPREDAYIADIVAVMGEPDSLVDGCYTYLTRPEFQGYLFLDTDKTGKVVGWKLENC